MINIFHYNNRKSNSIDEKRPVARRPIGGIECLFCLEVATPAWSTSGNSARQMREHRTPPPKRCKKGGVPRPVYGSCSSEHRFYYLDEVFYFLVLQITCPQTTSAIQFMIPNVVVVVVATISDRYRDIHNHNHFDNKIDWLHLVGRFHEKSKAVPPPYIDRLQGA